MVDCWIDMRSPVGPFIWHAIVRLPDCGPLGDKHEQASAGLLVIADQLLALGELDRVTNGRCGDVHVDSQEPPQRRLVPGGFQAKCDRG